MDVIERISRRLSILYPHFRLLELVEQCEHVEVVKRTEIYLREIYSWILSNETLSGEEMS